MNYGYSVRYYLDDYMTSFHRCRTVIILYILYINESNDTKKDNVNELNVTFSRIVISP